jgi:hypothetical protein
MFHAAIVGLALGVATQAKLTTTPDHNDTRQDRIGADGADGSRPVHGLFPTVGACLISEGSAAVRSRLRWGPLGDHTPCTHPDNRHLGTPTAPHWNRTDQRERLARSPGGQGVAGSIRPSRRIFEQPWGHFGTTASLIRHSGRRSALRRLTTASRICPAAAMPSCPVAASSTTWCDSGP